MTVEFVFSGRQPGQVGRNLQHAEHRAEGDMHELPKLLCSLGCLSRKHLDSYLCQRELSNIYLISGRFLT